MTTLHTAVYTAHRGYSWSSVPPGTDERMLEGMLADAAERRGEFPDPASVERGAVSNGSIAAAFAIRSVQAWDAEGRSADYAAFAFLPLADASLVDIAALLEHPFFCVPSRNPPAAIEYAGPASATPPLDAPGRLLCQGKYDMLDPRAIGALLSTYGANSPKWVFHISGGTASVATAPWKR